ncbi:MAG: hypothetical protein IID46_12370 [Planctomycetes bacterium]|nr:hypothetical protein [Planctomycetota bacterium]
MVSPTITTTDEFIPEELKQRPQWVCWKYARRGNHSQNQWCKLPVSPIDGNLAKANRQSTWTDFETALSYYARFRHRLAGVGFMFSEHDPFVGIDLDKCRNIDTGRLTPWSQSLVTELNSYTEISPSGTGVKCIVKSSRQIPSRRKSSLGIEIYSSNRYFAITGHPVSDQLTIYDRTTELTAIQSRLFPSEPVILQGTSWPQHNGAEMPDHHVMQRAETAKNGWKFLRLWKGDRSLHSNNHSDADLSLCRILAFWCGPNPDQIDRLFRQSALFREKWGRRHFANGSTYGEETIRRAITAQAETFFRCPTGMG